MQLILMSIRFIKMIIDTIVIIMTTMMIMIWIVEIMKIGFGNMTTIKKGYINGYNTI